MKGMIVRMIFSILVLFSGGISANTATVATGIKHHGSELPEGVWGKIRRHMEESQYAISHDDKNWRGFSPAQGYKIDFSHQGLTITQPFNGKRHTFGMSLSSWGTASNQQTLKPARIHATGQRIEYHRDSITEWYLNKPAGLEQGFTVHKKPKDGDIELALALIGDLTPQLDAEGQSLSLSHNNHKILQYSGLKVWDANGHILSSHMRLLSVITIIDVLICTIFDGNNSSARKNIRAHIYALGPHGCTVVM